jgi:hypothetical protein
MACRPHSISEISYHSTSHRCHSRSKGKENNEAMPTALHSDDTIQQPARLCPSRMRSTPRGAKASYGCLNSDRLRNGVDWLLSGSGYLLLQRHGTIGEYDRSSRASRPSALDACAPEPQSHGCCDEGNAAKGTPDNCRDLLPFVAVALRLGGQELRLRRR